MVGGWSGAGDYKQKEKRSHGNTLTADSKDDMIKKALQECEVSGGVRKLLSLFGVTDKRRGN